MYNKKGKTTIFIIIALILIMTIVIFAVYYFKYIKNNNIDNETSQTNNKVVNPPKTLQLFKGNDRTIAVMIDNEKPAWPHSGLNDAYMIYEIIVEGGETRMMALFKGATTEKIGPVRSSRHYYTDYVQENNAIYVHYGWSPLAQKAIKNNNINNINGITSDGSIFWRVGAGYHNAYTSVKNILKLAKSKEYLTVTSQESLYKYQAEEYNIEDGIDVYKINIKYSNLHNVSYEYDDDKKVFLRWMRSIKDVDRETKEQYYAKNIIMIFADNYTLNDGENKGRQQVETVGEGTGYYATNGKYQKITWKKQNSKSKTYIYDINGKEIILNDGITYFQVVPKTGNIELLSPINEI